jgi:hypothetical protein
MIASRINWYPCLQGSRVCDANVLSQRMPPLHQSINDKESLDHNDSTMEIKVIGDMVIILLDLSKEEYDCFQVPLAAEEATTTTARPQEATDQTTGTMELAGRFNN